ncbi:homeobox-domain-containing protein [Amylocystis lapponica]|nr:homeobox-domain-containing protein [Amylocystis lapponica]
MSNHPSEEHFSYGCFGRPTRRSPAGGGTNNSNNNGRRGLFHIGQGGRTVLPPLHLPFRTSRSPVPDPSFSANQYPQQEPPQVRNEFNTPGYGQSGWPSNTPTGHHPSAPTDPRYSVAQPSYGSYPDSRTLPPLNMPQGQLHSGASNVPMGPGAHIRSPSAGYPASYAPYQDHPQQASTSYYPSAPDPRNLPPPVNPMGFDASSGMMPRRGSMSVDRTVPSRMSSMHGPSPYPRNPPIVAPSPYTPEPPAPESPIKKKRKRADAEQLKVLNETYSRTAFPSTEERIELAKKLGMSARSVQIWFQNKRQAMRQSTRQASTSIPPTTNEPFPGSSHSSSPSGLPNAGGYGSHPNPMGPSSISQAYGVPQSGSRLIPSPVPSLHHRGRSPGPDEEERSLRRYGSRPY